MSWEKVTLGEISGNIQTGPFGSQLHQSDYSIEGIPVVMPKDLLDGRISESSIARVDEAYAERLKRHKIEIGNILYSRRGDVGKCAYATEKESGWLCGTGCLRVEINADRADSKFVFYSLQLPNTIGWLENHAVGSTMLNLNTSILSAIPLTLPDIDTQKRIADILANYDNLIENNQKQIKLLEEAAQRIYKEWFVDLHFPGYENSTIIDGVPEGWSLTEFSNIFEYVRGKSYTSKELSDNQGTLMVNLKNIQAFGGYNRNAEKHFMGTCKDEQTLESGDVVMGVTDMTQERRLVGHVAMIPTLQEKSTFSMDLIKLIPKHVTRNYLYCAFRFGGYSSKVSSLANGVNVLHLKPEAMMNLKILVPEKTIMDTFDEQFEMIRLKIDVIQKQIDLAKEARDRLLPKLMSGEIEV